MNQVRLGQGETLWLVQSIGPRLRVDGRAESGTESARRQRYSRCLRVTVVSTRPCCRLHFKAGRDIKVLLEHAVLRLTMSMVLNWVRFVDGIHFFARERREEVRLLGS
jgi:hypothetical protein